jgi:hypothetical protein
VIVSRTVPPAADTVLTVAADAGTAEDGFVSPVTTQETAAFKAAAVVSVISRPLAAENVVAVTGAFTLFRVQVAVGVPVNVGKPVTEIKATLFVASVPVKLTVKVAATDATLLVNAVEAV